VKFDLDIAPESHNNVKSHFITHLKTHRKTTKEGS